jgi:ketosteroid isomerase-like protein
VWVPALPGAVEGATYRGRAGILGYLSESTSTWEQLTAVCDELRELDDSEAIVWRTTPEDPDATTHRGRDAVRCYLNGYIESFPDLRIEATECFLLDDGRIFNASRFVGRSAQGVPMDWSLTVVSTVEDGLFVRAEEYFDRAHAVAAVELGA